MGKAVQALAWAAFFLLESLVQPAFMEEGWSVVAGWRPFLT